MSDKKNTLVDNVTVLDGATVYGSLNSVGGATGRTFINTPIHVTGSWNHDDVNFIAAADAASYDTISVTIGTIDVSNKSLILLDFSAFDGDDFVIETVELPTPVNGQVIKIIVKIGASSGTHGIEPDNIGNLIGGKWLVFGSDYCSVDFIGIDDNWIYSSLQGVTVEDVPI